MTERASCRYCGAAILWVDSEHGRRMPLDYEPEKRFVLDGTRSPMIARMRNTYTSHFSTCPHADEARQRGGSSE